MSTLEIPGYRVVPGARVTPEAGLRNDVAAFLGRTERGPVGVPVRVAGRRAYAAIFGGLAVEAATPRVVEAYFANEGEVAWVLRTGRGGASASAEVELGQVRCALPGERLRVTASSPGRWADGATARVTYRAFGVTGEPEFDVRIEIPGTPAFGRAGLRAEQLAAAIDASGLLTAAFAGAPVDAVADGPASRRWTLTLAHGEDPLPSHDAYLEATAEQGQIEEIALVCAPDLEDDLSRDEHDDVVAALASAAAATQDRLLILAARTLRPAELVAWRARIARVLSDPARRRAVAAYAPWLVAEDLARRGVDRYVPTNPVGHVCGVIASLDRDRGSGWAPANTLVNDAIDVVDGAGEGEQVVALNQQLNLLRVRPGGGLEIWGARTLDPYDGRQIAHRRLVHRVVRAIRRVAEPLVFDSNGPLLWFAVVRAVSGVLLEAFRTGALQGETPDQAYRVTCDETTNTPDRVEAGEVVCEIEIAPAVPMEFITLRLTLGAQGLLEVVEQ